jgi:hypothetical protein
MSRTVLDGAREHCWLCEDEYSPRRWRQVLCKQTRLQIRGLSVSAAEPVSARATGLEGLETYLADVVQWAAHRQTASPNEAHDAEEHKGCACQQREQVTGATRQRPFTLLR